MAELPYERLFLIQNPNSTRAKDVQGSVLDQLGHAGIAYVLMQTPSPKYEDNVDAIMGNIRVGDRIISLGGDGTGSQVFNAVWGLPDDMRCDVAVGYQPIGNFNDMSRATCGSDTDIMAVVSGEADTVDLRPMEIIVD